MANGKYSKLRIVKGMLLKVKKKLENEHERGFNKGRETGILIGKLSAYSSGFQQGVKIVRMISFWQRVKLLFFR